MRNEAERYLLSIKSYIVDYLVVAFPIDEKSVFVNFEQAVRLILGRLFVFEPSIEHRTLPQELRHFDAPIKFELLRHSSATLSGTLLG
jgi:hypothetical protein